MKINLLVFGLIALGAVGIAQQQTKPDPGLSEQLVTALHENFEAGVQAGIAGCVYCGRERHFRPMENLPWLNERRKAAYDQVKRSVRGSNQGQREQLAP